MLLGSSWELLGSSWELLGSARVLLGPGHEKEAKGASGKTSKYVTYKGSNAFSKNAETAFTDCNWRFGRGPGEAICHRSKHTFLGPGRPPEACQARRRPLRPPGPLRLYMYTQTRKIPSAIGDVGEAPGRQLSPQQTYLSFFWGGQGRKGEPPLILGASQVLLKVFGVLPGSSLGS